MQKPIVLHQTDGRKVAFNPDHVAMVTPALVMNAPHERTEQAGIRGAYVVIAGHGGGTYVNETYEQVMELWLDRIGAAR